MKLIVLLICIAGITAGVMGQTASAGSWIKVVSEKGGVSFALPSDFLVFHEKDSDKVTTYANANSYSITVSINEGGREGICWPVCDGQLDSSRDTGDKITAWKAGDFDISMRTGHGKRSTVTISAASSKCFLWISTSSKRSDDPVIMSFLMSVMLGDKPFFTRSATPALTTDREVSLWTLASSPVIDEALRHKQGDKIEVESGRMVNESETDDDATYSRPLLILRQPYPKFSDHRDIKQWTAGTVTLRAVFKANGDVGTISVFGGVKKMGISDTVVDAVKKIKFVPAQIDGKNVDATKTITYTMSAFPQAEIGPLKWPL